MGIKNLNNFLRDKCQQVFVPVHLSEYEYKKIAIDISLYLFKFKATCGDNWLSAFINLVISLRRNEIHCVFIYDGKSPPEKEPEKEKRRQEKIKLEEKVYKLNEALDNYHKTGSIDNILQEMYQKRRSPSQKRLLGKKSNEKINMNWVEKKIEEKNKQIIDIDSSDFLLTKQLFDIMKIPYYTAPWEAEKMCSKLCIDGLVDAVLSEDTDVIAYGTPHFLTKIETKNDTCVLIKNENVLENLNMKQNQLLDLCIMCGTDYNDNIFRVGPQTAYKNLIEHENIEGIEQNITKYDISVLKYIRVRQLFTTFDDYQITSIPYCSTPDFNALQLFVNTHKLNINVENIQSNFIREIIFADSDDES